MKYVMTEPILALFTLSLKSQMLMESYQPTNSNFSDVAVSNLFDL